MGEDPSEVFRILVTEGKPMTFVGKPDKSEDLDIKTYMARVADAVSSQRRWRVDSKAIVLGFFSYAKYLMFKDLEGTHWPEQSKPCTHSVLGALLDSGFDDDDPGISEEENLFSGINLPELGFVCSKHIAGADALHVILKGA